MLIKSWNNGCSIHAPNVYTGMIKSFTRFITSQSKCYSIVEAAHLEEGKIQ